MAKANIALLCNRAGDAECLQAFADGGGGLACRLHAGFQRNGNAKRISPNGVFKSNGLNALYDFFHIDALGKAEIAGFLKACKTILCKTLLDFGHSSLFAFEFYIVSHSELSSFIQSYYSSRGSIYFFASLKRP